MKLLKDFQIKNIIVSEDFKNTPPGKDKIEWAEQYYLKTGKLQNNIIINDSNVLIDGYITYLLAVLHKVEQVDVYRGYVEVAEAVHYVGSSKRYMWRVPMRLLGMININDYIIVPTSTGAKRVKVVNVMRQQYPEQGKRLKQIYKKCATK